MELLQSFTLKLLKWGIYLTNHLSESIHIWTKGTLEGRLSVHESLLKGPCPRVGQEVKIYDILKSVCLLFCYENTYVDSWSDMTQPCGMDLWVMKWPIWPIFHGLVILLYIWCMNIILWNYESVWHDIWPQNKFRSLWPIFHVPVILPYSLKTIWYMNSILWDYESIWHDVWPQNICRTLWPTFYGFFQWFCLESWTLFSGWTSYFRSMNQYDLAFDLKINAGHCDL